jgi:3-hydroxyacyl-CoA dehydrogenase
MGAQIAAHAANAGLSVLLLDLDAATAREGLKRARKLKPEPFFTSETAGRIATGGFDTDLARVGETDWVVEAVVERLDVKQELLARVEPHRAPHAVVSSNTSGIPIASLADGRGEAFRRHWLGTHFFNPPRYLPLLEIVPTADTDPAVIEAMVRFGDQTLGKGVVVAKDTPNFIGNRIGMFGAMRVLEQLAGDAFTIEEIDAMTGPAIGRPRSATFRTLDIAGLDVLAHVATNLAERLENAEERASFVLPRLVADMVERGWLGAKAGGGFYKKQKTAAGSEVLTLDPRTMDYRARRSPRLPALDAAAAIEDHGERIRTLFQGSDRVGAFLRATLAPTLVYAAEVAPAIAHSIDDIDRAMRWGFGWELGPFELWDAIGVDAVLDAAGRAAPPALVGDLQRSAPAGTVRFRAGAVPPRAPDLQLLPRAKAGRPPVRRNAGASLVDLGDGVLGLEFHSKMNAIGGDTVAMMRAGVEEASRNFEALVIGNDAPAFSAGANLMLLLLEAQEENWDEIDLMVRTFQSAVLGLRYASVPVVAAPAGLALGGGCEIVLHADRVQAAAETYMGQVEVGAGLIPAGCGTKELLARFTARVPAGAADPLPHVQQAFELIGFGKVSTSAADARRLGLLRDTDAATMNRERLLTDAKAAALELSRAGYQPPARPNDIPVGGAGVRAALDLGVHLAWRGGRISDYDAHIGRTLSRILAGGDLPHATTVSEQRLLDLEREAFLSLCGEPKTQERIAHVLKTGKPLRN